MAERHQAPQHHAYVLRFWETRSLPPDPPRTWRFSLEGLRTDEAHKFPDLDSLVSFLQARLGQNGSEQRPDDVDAPAPTAQPSALPSLQTSLLLIEEDEAIRGSVRRWLADVLPHARISDAGDDDQALALIRSQDPEVILVDVAPPKEDGLATLRRLRAAAPHAALVALTMEERETEARQDALLAAGASATVAIWRMREDLLPTLHDLLPAPHDEVRGKTVVCVEDEIDLINLIQFALARHGVDLVGAMGGREGLDTIRRVKPDLVLLDLMMPDIDGWQVYQRMKADEELRHIPVIVITVLEPYWSAKQGLDLSDVDGYVTKPFVPQELAEQVQNTLQVVA